MAEVTQEVKTTDEVNPDVDRVPHKGDVTVTSETFSSYVADKMGLAKPDDADVDVDPNPPPEDNSPEAKAAAELAAIDAKKAADQKEADAKAAVEAGPKEGDVEGNKVFFKGKWTGKHDFAYRLHTQTAEKAKEAEEKIAAAEKAAAEKITAAEARAKAASEAREAIEAEARRLKERYEPVKELGPEPAPGDFTDVVAYSKALKEWTQDATRREIAAKDAESKAMAEKQAVAKAWNDKLTETRKEIPEYDQIINAATEVKVSDHCRDAIIESDNGPKIFLHLAQNPDVADAIGKMPIGRMLREIGRLDAVLGSTPAKATETAPIETKEKTAPVKEISRAPAPITPLRGLNAMPATKFDSAGNWLGTVDEWRAAERAGKFANL